MGVLDIERAQREMEQTLRGEAPIERLAQEAQPYYERLMAEIRRRNEWWRDLPPRRSAYAYLGRLAGEIGIPHAFREYVITLALNDMYSYGKIQRLIDDPLVSDIQMSLLQND